MMRPAEAMTLGTAPRIATLDILRGVAVLGILAMNIVDFALPAQGYANPTALAPASAADFAAWAASFILVDGKMRGLFSLLFGASMLLVIERADARDEASAAIHFRRMLWLGIIGLAHYVLIWRGDILFEYAVAGAAAWFFHQLEVPRLVRFGLLFLLVYFGLQALTSAGHLAVAAAAAVPDAGADALTQARALENGFGRPDPGVIAGTLALYRGGWEGIVAHRIALRAQAPFSAVLPYGWEALGYMLLGMAALRAGFLTGAWPDRLYRRIAAWTILPAIVVQAALAALLVRTDFPAALVFAVHEAGAALVRPPMVIGYAAAIILLSRGGGALSRRLAAAGRTAFTNYLAASIVMTFLFYGYGFSLYGHLGRAELWLVVLPAWALMLAWPALWLAHFRYGPFEWLWRSLARGALQPMRGPARAD
jgi:uncharacterized protein